MKTPARVMTMPDRYICMFLTHRDVSELFNTFSKYTPVPEDDFELAEAKKGTSTDVVYSQRERSNNHCVPANPEQMTATAMATNPKNGFCST